MKSEYRVFISSTSDLREERLEAVQAVLTANCIPVLMETWPATEHSPETVIKEKLGRCKFFVLLAGFEYGDSVPGGTQSYVEMELDLALKFKIPAIILIQEGSGQIDKQQSVFRDNLKARHTIRPWRDRADIARTVLGSLMETVNLWESSTVYANNSELVDEVRCFLERTRWRRAGGVATLIQYSAHNARNLVRLLVSAEIRTDLYIKCPVNLLTDCDGRYKYWLSDYQEQRINDNIFQIRNELQHVGEGIDIERQLNIYAYNAPGAIRALSIKLTGNDYAGTEFGEGEELVALGSYVYMMEDIPEKRQRGLDIRGGEMPGILLLRGHSGFDAVAKMIRDTVANWKNYESEYRLRTPIQWYRVRDAPPEAPDETVKSDDEDLKPELDGPAAH